jgi:peptide/nickel transport system ATP-binding protein
MLKVNIKSVNTKDDSNSIELLNEINFTLSSSNIYSIIGSNGSGKSTLLLTIVKLLNSKEYSVEGKVLFNGTDIFELSEEEYLKVREKNFRIIFQDPISTLDPLRKLKYYFELFNFSIDEIERELNYFQLPNYNKLSKLYPHQLSTGMAQRVNIVLALLSNPAILLLDEPTSALDLPSANLLLKRLKTFVNENEKIVLLVTQDLQFAKVVSNYIARMDTGSFSQFLEPNIFFEEEK